METEGSSFNNAYPSLLRTQSSLLNVVEDHIGRSNKPFWTLFKMPRDVILYVFYLKICGYRNHCRFAQYLPSFVRFQLFHCVLAKMFQKFPADLPRLQPDQLIAQSKLHFRRFLFPIVDQRVCHFVAKLFKVPNSNLSHSSADDALYFWKHLID